MASSKKKPQPSRLHPRNRNRERYDLEALTVAIPELQSHIVNNPSGQATVDFSDPLAVRLLNKALLKHNYGIEEWAIPDWNLCPPIPGRADYLHHIADLLATENGGEIPKGDQITCLDIGVGASCIYPILGVVEYGWKFIGTDIDPKTLESAQAIVDANPILTEKIELRLQEDRTRMFRGILGYEERIDLSICNPPFHASVKEAQQGTRRKIRNLSGKNVDRPTLNFGGVNRELIYEGGEVEFLRRMVRESKMVARRCRWFSSLVSKQSTLKGLYRQLEKVEARRVETIPMGTGNKVSRIVAWTFGGK